ncbi:hypothetical protein [Tessaracoccus massiliensis]|uniref:hypothetical protein n=1 Tax=Tessaracoccus massiliensis TaxID=1522311 RepID=UPI0005914AFF|nr:hypothetical protein [Tessaracoccus massiliensis]
MRIAGALVAVIVAVVGVVTPTPAAADVDVYTTPGAHKVGGREWRTTCSMYSSTVERCRTEIKATTVTFDGRGYVEQQGWLFNNLTYKASPRESWSFMNPLVTPGDHTVNGRKWRTECDTAWTGSGGCRSQLMATVIEKGKGGYQTVNKYVFNNIVHVKPVPCAVTQDQVRRDVGIPTTVVQGCTRSSSNSSWTAVDVPVLLPDGYRYMSTAFYRLSGSRWRLTTRSGPNWQICRWARDNGAPKDLVDKHLAFCR